MTLLTNLKECPICSSVLYIKNYDIDIIKCANNGKHFSLHLSKDSKVKFLRIMNESYYVGSTGKNINIHGITYIENDYITEYMTSIEEDPSTLHIEYILEKANIIKLFS